MQIVIEIPEEVYKAYKLDFNLSFLNSDQQSFARGCLINGLLNGTPLPKQEGILDKFDDYRRVRGLLEIFDKYRPESEEQT